MTSSRNNTIQYVSTTKDSTRLPPRSEVVERRWNELLAPIIRKSCYDPDGIPPKNWTLKQDLRICKLALLRGRLTPADLADCIRGLRLIFPKGIAGQHKFTLKILLKDEHGNTRKRAMKAARSCQPHNPNAAGLRFIKDALRDASAA